jgi:hypothetical protein
MERVVLSLQPSPVRDHSVVRRKYPVYVLASIGKILGLFVAAVVAVLATLLHVWYRGVLHAPEVKRRKAARRRARRAVPPY